MAEVPTRNEKGQFVKGTSGNPSGRPVGIKNETAMVKEFIANALVNELQEDAIEILQVAIKKAKSGSDAMIKLLLKDLIATKDDEESDSGDVVIKVKNLTLQQPQHEGVTLDHEDIHE